MKIIKYSQNKKTNLAKIIKTSVETLKKGGLIIYPTETVYGVGVDATNQQAVDKILKYKGNRQGKPISVAVDSLEMAKQYTQINQQAQKIYDNFMPGPVTIVSQGLHKLTQGIESEFGTLGIRIPDHKLINEISKRINKPITSTSANSVGNKTPYKIADILDHLSNKKKKLIDLIIDAGTLPKNEPSTVIDTTLSTPLVIRQGEQLKTILKKVLGNTQKEIFQSHNPQETQGLAGRLCLKNWNNFKQGPLIFALDGKLGAGKTIFAKGVAKFLHIKTMITSPTYTYIKEYPYEKEGRIGKMYHLDMWKINQNLDIESLDIEDMLEPHNVLIIEWWQQVAASLLPIFEKNKKMKLIKLNFKVKSKKNREIKIWQ